MWRKSFHHLPLLQDLPILHDAVLHYTHPWFLLFVPLLHLLYPQCFLLVSQLSQASKSLSPFQSFLEMKVGILVSQSLVVEQQIQTFI